MKKPYLLLAFFSLSFAPLAKAKPLSDVGDPTMRQENAETGHSLCINSTFDSHFAQIPK